MRGINASTGKPIEGFEHLKQSITDILCTPIGTRVMRRDYGSNLFNLIDRPVNRGGLLEIYAATIDALSKWEPRLSVESVKATSASAGRIVVNITGVYFPEGKAVEIDNVVIK